MTLLKRLAGLFKRSAYNAASGSPRWGKQTMAAPVAQTHAAAHLTGTRAAFAVGNIPLAASLADVYRDALYPDTPTIQLATRSREVERAAALFFASISASVRTLILSQFRTGEGLARMRATRGGALRIDVLNNEQLDRSVNRELENGGRIVQGVEEDAHGEVVAYWILPDAPDQLSIMIVPARRIPADDIIFLFDQKFPGQRRGISELAPVMPRLHEYEKLFDAMAARANTAALFGGFVTDASSTGFTDAEARAPEADLTMEPGALRVLPVGTDIKFPTMPDGGDAISLLKAMARDICAGVGIPYVLATGDLSDTNYSSGKLGIESFKRRIKAQRASLLVPLVLEPIFKRWALLRLLSGNLQADSFNDVSFLFPEFASIEPKREAEADLILLNAGLRSRKEIIAARGRDIEDVDSEITADTFVPKVAPKADQTQENENA